MAGQLAAADLQLRRDPAGGRQPVRVRRPRRAPRHLRRSAPRAGGGRLMSHVLVIANETAASSALLDALRHKDSSEDRFTVIAPVNEPARGYVVYEDTRRASAGRRLEQTLKALREAGFAAQGFVVETGPVQAVKDALAQLEPKIDEIVVSTHPAERSGWMRRNVVEDIERAAGGVPVTHVVAGREEAGRNVLVIANQTVVSPELLDRIRTR